MPRVFDAKVLLQGALFDAQKRLDSGQIRLAFKILKKKLRELEIKESTDYVRVRWDG